MRNTIKDCQIIGASKRCLILDIDGKSVFCSTRNYADLINNPQLKWEVVPQPEHRVVNKFGQEQLFRESFWVVAYVPRML